MRVPEGYVVMFETGNYMGSDLKSGDMAYSKRNNRFVLIENLDKYPDTISNRTCVIRRYIPEEVKRLVDVVQRHAASKAEDDTIVEAKENIDRPKETIADREGNMRCFNSGCDDFSYLQNNNCERVFDISQCVRARYNTYNDGTDDFDEY